MNDPLRVAREGPFWAGMFVVLGAVVGFGGTIEVRKMIYFSVEGPDACCGPSQYPEYDQSSISMKSTASSLMKICLVLECYR